MMQVFDLHDLIERDDSRDYAEEAYWREFCPACGVSPCAGLCGDDNA